MGAEKLFMSRSVIRGSGGLGFGIRQFGGHSQRENKLDREMRALETRAHWAIVSPYHWGCTVPEIVHIVKLCVGVENFEDLEERYKARGGSETRHVTRMRPKREAEILAGGSLYWVIKGVVQARQSFLDLEEVIGADGIRRCAFVLDRELIRTAPAPRRAFQGWRYLTAKDAPADLTKARAMDVDLPPELANALSDIGLV